MQLTPTYQLKKPEGTDPVDIQDFNDNADAIDAALKKKAESSGGDISEMTVKTLDNITTEFPVPAAGEKPKTFLAKVQKFIQDFNNLKTGLLTVGQLVNNCVTNNPSLPLSAAQGKVLMDLYTVLNTNLENKLDRSKVLFGDLSFIRFELVDSGKSGEFYCMSFRKSATYWMEFRLYTQNPIYKASLVEVNNGVYTWLWRIDK